MEDKSGHRHPIRLIKREGQEDEGGRDSSQEEKLEIEHGVEEQERRPHGEQPAEMLPREWPDYLVLYIDILRDSTLHISLPKQILIQLLTTHPSILYRDGHY